MVSGETASAIDHLKVADQTDPFRKLLLARAYEKAGFERFDTRHSEYGPALMMARNAGGEFA